MNAIARKSLVFKEEGAEEPGGFSWRGIFGVPFRSKFFSQVIEALYIMGNIDIRIGYLGDEECTLLPIHLPGAVSDEGGKFFFELLKTNFILNKGEPWFQCRIFRAGLFQKR